MSTRLEIRDKFRAENPEVTSRVLTDATLNEWMKTANKEVCCATKCIVSNVSQTFNTVAGTQYYDLETRIDNFYDIDHKEGGGVYFDDVPIEKASPAEMNKKRPRWRSSSSGTPRYWWRRGKYLWFDVAPSAANDVDIDCILYPDDFNSDGEMPFNELEHLQVYDDSISKYLQWRALGKLNKPQEAAIAYKDYQNYLAWMKKMVRSAKSAAIYLRPQ